MSDSEWMIVCASYKEQSDDDATDTDDLVCVCLSVSLCLSVSVCLSVCVCLSLSVCLRLSVCTSDSEWMAVCASYKEQSDDDATDSDDLIEVEMTEADHEREAAETIEKVLRHRVGRKGGQFFLVDRFL